MCAANLRAVKPNRFEPSLPLALFLFNFFFLLYSPFLCQLISPTPVGYGCKTNSTASLEPISPQLQAAD